MAASLLNSYTAFDTVSGTTLAGGVTITNTVNIGDVLVLATLRNSSAGNTPGVSAIAGDGASNNFVLNVAGSVRANSLDINLHVLDVVATITGGAVLTITHNQTGNRKGAVLAHFTGVDGTVDAKSAAINTATTGENSQNTNGSGSFESVTTTGATTVTNSIVVGAMSMTSGNSLTVTGGDTLIGQIQSSVGSADRGVSLQWRTTSTIATKTSTATQGASGVWACANITLPILSTGGTLPSQVVIGGAKKDVVGGSVVIGGAKKTIVGTSVIVGGAKKSLT